MIRALLCRKQEAKFTEITDFHVISEMLADDNHVFWLDLLSPTAEELALVGEEFRLHHLALEDATQEHQRPKVEEYDHFYFLVFYGAGLDAEKKLKIQELNMFWGKNFLITVHYEKMAELDEAERRWKRSAQVTHVGLGILLYSLLDSLVDNYFPVMDELVRQSDELEEAIFLQQASRTQITFDVLALKKSFLELRRIATPERDVLNVLTNRDQLLFNEQTIAYFRDVYDHVSRVAETIDVYRDQLSSMMDAHLSVASNDLNQVMRTLTSTSIILMSVTLVASVYGMNFDTSASPWNMPELHMPFGYVGALSLMLFIGVTLYAVFKWRRWL